MHGNEVYFHHKALHFDHFALAGILSSFVVTKYVVVYVYDRLK